ncbi:uncharacterized protein VP01_7459g1, partial [Puccinia sorghi]
FIDSISSRDELSLEQIDDNFLTAPEHEEQQEICASNQVILPKPKPGWDIVLAPDKATKDISSAIDESKILHTKRRVCLARALQAAGITKTYREAMLSSNTSSWTKAIEAELLNIKSSKKFNLLVDNQSAIALAINPLFQQRMKPIDIIFHWLREIYDSG